MRQEKRQKRSFLSLLAKFNPSSLTVIVMLFVFLVIWGTGVAYVLPRIVVDNTFGSYNRGLTTWATTGQERNTAEHDAAAQKLAEDAELNNLQGLHRNKVLQDNNKNAKKKHELNQEKKTLENQVQNADYNEVVFEPQVLASDSFSLFTSDIKYQVRRCKESAVKSGPFTFCLSNKEEHNTRLLQECGFECVPHLSKAEFDAAMVINEAQDRLGEFWDNVLGVKAWFKLFSVIGQHSAKEKFKHVFDAALEDICLQLEVDGGDLNYCLSVRNVCGLFKKGLPLLSDKPHSLQSDPIISIGF